jgi:hypothetical protein
MVRTPMWYSISLRSFKPSGNKDPQKSTNPCTNRGTTSEKTLLLTTSTSDQDQKKTEKPV